MKKTLWLILTAFVLSTVSAVPAMAAPAQHGKSALHQSTIVKGKKHHHKQGKKHHHKKGKGAKRHGK